MASSHTSVDWRGIKCQAESSSASGDFMRSVDEYRRALEGLEASPSSPQERDRAELLVAQCGALLELHEWDAAAGVATRAVETSPKWDQGAWSPVAGRDCGMAMFSKGGP